MSRLVECVPNFSEGNNQEVRCQGGSARGVGQGARGPLGVGLGVSYLKGDTSHQPQRHVCPVSVGNLEVTDLGQGGEEGGGQAGVLTQV